MINIKSLEEFSISDPLELFHDIGRRISICASDAHYNSFVYIKFENIETSANSHVLIETKLYAKEFSLYHENYGIFEHEDKELFFSFLEGILCDMMLVYGMNELEFINLHKHAQTVILG